MEILNPAASCLLVIDPQERLMKAVEKPEMVISNTELLLRCASIMNIPVLATTQYKKGLGPIVTEIEKLLSSSNISEIDKTEFNCFYNSNFQKEFEKLPAAVNSIVITGVEAHICVFQTAVSAANRGLNTWVVTDAISSRAKKNKKAAIKLMNSQGIHCGTTEMIIYQWLKQAGTKEFKAMLEFLK